MTSQLVVRNKKAYHNYQILDRYEAGIVLTGTEVKSIRNHRVNLKDGYAKIKDGELWLEHCHISSYSHRGFADHDPVRSRKLLLHRREINKLVGKTTRKGFTIVPLCLKWKRGRVKVEIAVARGKHLYDKREAARRRVIEREIQAELKGV